MLSVLAQFKATAQNCQQAPSIDCGTLTANSGLCTSNVFCIGDSVGIQNNGSTGTIDSTYICWGDGTMDWYSGVFSGCKKHRYAFPVDSCVGGNGTLPVNIVFGVKSYCPGLFSLSWILTPVTIKFQPKARFTLNPNPACVYQPVTFTDQSCPNSNTATYLWNFGDGTTSTSPNPPTHIYTIAGQYTVTLSITNSCATSTVIHTITILPPTVVAPIVISPLCAPASFTPDVNSQNATSFLWSFTAGTGSITAPPDSQPLITLPNPGTYGIHLAVTGCCLGPVARCSWDTTLTVYVAPTTSVTHIPDFCGNASFNPLTYFHISGGTVNSYSWSFPGGSPSSSTLATPGNVTYTGLGTYIITLVLTTPCGPITLTDTFSTLPPTIVQPLVTLPSACAPATIVPDVNSVNATGFTWSLNGGSAGVVSPQDSQPSITLNTSGSFAIHLVAQGCCTAPTSDCVWDTVLNLLQGPSISQTPVPDFCGTASLTPSTYITASGAITTYAWTFPGGSPPTSNVANPGTITYSSPGTYIIHLSVTSPCGPQNVSDTFVISPPTIVQPLVTLPAACSPVTFIPDINSQNATGFNWTLNGGTAGITSPQDSQPSIAINTSGVFAIHLQAQGCCTAPTSDCVWDTSVTILQGPSISQTSIPDFCGSAIISPSMYISASGAITTYAWTFVGGSPPSSSSANPGSVSYLTPGTYIVQLNVTSPCGPSSVTDTFKVEAPTVVQPISNIPGICTPLSFVPDVNSQNATGFLWSTLAGNAVITVPTDSQPTFSVTNVGTLTIQVVASGCCIDPQSNCTWDTTVTLTEGPSIVTSAIPLFCDSATVNPANYFTTSGGISSYSWSFPGGTPLSSTSASPGNVSYSSPGVYLITLLLNGPCGTIQKTDSVQIGAPPSISIVPSTLFGCDSLTISFTNTSPGNQTYLWTANGGTFVGGSTSTSNAPFIFFSAPGSYAISVETFSAGCPSITNNFPVNLGEAPHLSVVASTPDVCDTITFIFSNYFQLTPEVSDSGYNWTILFNANIIYSDSSTNPPPFQIGAYGTYIVQSSVWNGCDTILLTDTFTISPPPTLTISSDTSICKGTPALNLFA
ncbi:MAG: PKD domain-containing protein, partial [Bacteroidetes bacterium]|nr:PKD domain-containing protein [Bacteroidota bacterium]